MFFFKSGVEYPCFPVLYLSMSWNSLRGEKSFLKGQRGKVVKIVKPGVCPDDT